MERLVRLRRELHARPELSNEESRTAESIREWLEAAGPDEIVKDLGGRGVAAVFQGAAEGPTVLLRADLDALPIPERSEAEHRSANEGVSHACGHDGHMTMVAALAPALAAHPPRRGRVVLLFQPAEEIGAGARRVVDDPAFEPLRPDMAFALHNLPGHPLGRVLIRPGTFAMGSVGLVVKLHGRTSHAAYPEEGHSPAPAMAELIRDLGRLGAGRQPGMGRCMATVIHARLGEIAFGTTPGEAVVMATLRSETEEGIRDLRESAVRRAREAATSHGLGLELEWRDPFPVTVNDAECVDVVVDVARSRGLEVVTMEEPIRWSEDFGWFLKHARGAMFGLGSGVDQPALHAPDYDFPDELLEVGVPLWSAVLERLTGDDADRGGADGGG